jgi:hypothetical protein
MSKTSRREFLITTVAAPLLVPALAGGTRLTSKWEETAQSNWRPCNKCNVLFYAGFLDKKGAPILGSCAAFGGHQPRSMNFSLFYDNSGRVLPETTVAQVNWRYCDRCFALFYDGYSEKGSCPAHGGGGHHAQGFNFLLEHANKRGWSPGFFAIYVQDDWRYCSKCHALFYDGDKDGFKGRCAAGNRHTAQGYNFGLSSSHGPTG